jgi:hypothetical protein
MFNFILISILKIITKLYLKNYKMMIKEIQNILKLNK